MTGPEGAQAFAEESDGPNFGDENVEVNNLGRSRTSPDHSQSGSRADRSHSPNVKRPRRSASKSPPPPQTHSKSRTKSRSPHSVSGGESKSRSGSRGRARRHRSRSGSRHRSRGHRSSRRRRSRSRSASSSRSRSRHRSPRNSRRQRYSRSRSRSRGRRQRYGRTGGGGRPMNSSWRDREKPPPSRVLGVFGMSPRTDERDLDRVFGKYGEIDTIKMIRDHRTEESRGFAFLYFQKVDDACDAREACNGINLHGRSIRTDFSLTERAHTPTPGEYHGERR